MDKLNEIKKYESEGIKGLAEAFKENPLVMRSKDFPDLINKEKLKAILGVVLLTDSRVEERFKVVSLDFTLDAVANEILGGRDECTGPDKETADFLQEAVKYFKQCRSYKMWKETSDGTNNGLMGAVLVAYSFDRKFNSLCREAGINNSSEATRIVIKQLLEQENKEE